MNLFGKIGIGLWNIHFKRQQVGAKIILTPIILLICFSCSKKVAVSDDSAEVERVEWIKDYAFYKCLKHAYDANTMDLIRSQDHTNSTLIDIADLWGDNSRIDLLAKSYVDSIPETKIPDYKGKKPYIFRCLQFRRSKELKQEIGMILKAEKDRKQ